MGLVATKYTVKNRKKILRIICDQSTQTDNKLSTITNDSSSDQHIQRVTTLPDYDTQEESIFVNDDTVSNENMSTQTDYESSITSEKMNSYDPRMMQASQTAPVDLFLIDISHEQVCVDQPISMNIRHLLMNTSEESRTKSPDTIYIDGELLDRVPTVCEKYPNLIVDPDQRMHSTLYTRLLQ